MLDGLRPHHWRWQADDQGILHLTLDRQGESANTLSREILRELSGILERLEADPPKGVLVLSGKSSGFIAGADVSEFEDYGRTGQVYQVLRNGQKIFDRLEALNCPTVAVIDGYCVGGGLELALACDYRVASDEDNTRLGFPEVMLGIHPGWGGTVRAPRIVGPQKAMELILTGRTLRAKAARDAGLVDRVVPQAQLTQTAVQMVHRQPKTAGAGAVGKLVNAWPSRQAMAQVIRKKTAAKANPKHYPAPFAAIDLWRKHGGTGAEAMKAEARSVAKLAATPTARNLVRVYFLRERLKAMARGDSGVQHVHVVGAGVMGGDIAAWCALRGFEVTLQDREEKYVAPAIRRAHELFRKKLKVPAKVQAAEARLRSDVAGDGVAEADLVIEAIFENLEAKKALYATLEESLSANALLATNTSSIPLQDLAADLAHPERFVGLHYFNPVPKMPLVEIVQHDGLDGDALQRALGFTGEIDKLPVPVSSTPGFLVNRVLFPYLLEAMLLHQEGVPGAVIDKAAKRFGMPMGPIELADQVGLDVAASVGQILADRLGFEVPDTLAAKVEGNRRGKKDGEGFYRYGEDGKPEKPEIPENYTPPADLTDRLLLPLLNECVRCLREGVVESPEMLDAGVIFGTGFAPFRGGPWQHIVDTGPSELAATLEELRGKYGERFAPDDGWALLPQAQTSDAA